MEDAIDVVLVDDHEIFRIGMRVVLQEDGIPSIRLCGEAHDAPTALALVEEHTPDVLITELKLGVSFEPGLQLIRDVRSASPHTRVLVMTEFDEGVHLIPAFQAGAHGGIAKEDPIESAKIRQGIIEVAQGGVYTSPLVMKELHKMIQRGADNSFVRKTLTRRECEVLALIADGATNQQIADQLTISIKTVKTHVSNILDKLHLESRYQAALYYHVQRE